MAVFSVVQYSGEDSRDRHTRIHTQSSPGFLERLGETMGGMAVGVVIFFLSFYVLFTNEVSEQISFTAFNIVT